MIMAGDVVLCQTKYFNHLPSLFMKCYLLEHQFGISCKPHIMYRGLAVFGLVHIKAARIFYMINFSNICELD
ncbi:hypothetical protein KM546_gp12 [Porcine lymphotropic herpesvirus 3]|uniref:Uncharacterized protein n=2 Tax=Macavirus suidgamma5 TaxID=3050359 RepID=Q772U8_9GAMA|nr:hypothetical protein KM546_gp12 [Porcine lymphotropic herpesvirus 3]AAO12305.1 unknown [Porcine lymphotropic herpesvirus 3]AAO12319.1 unknown [Porcine lymphotropic herpesvirus 3]